MPPKQTATREVAFLLPMTERTTSAARGYGFKWQKARLAWLQEHPLCVMCGKAGRITEATVVDHIQPHRGDQKLFWSRSNWQSLCATHHSKDKQRLEKSGTATAEFDQHGRVIW